MVSCADAGKAASAQEKSAALRSVVFIWIYLPVRKGWYLAFGGNQSPRETPVRVTRRQRAVGFLERTNFQIAETQPGEQAAEVHFRQRLHERLVVPPAVAEMDQPVEFGRRRQEVE